MNTVAQILGLIPVAVQTVNGVESLVQLIATLHAGGALSDSDVETIRADAALADANYDAAIEAAKARLA